MEYVILRALSLWKPNPNSNIIANPNIAQPLWEPISLAFARSKAGAIQKVINYL
jgi:hypothetical protein